MNPWLKKKKKKKKLHESLSILCYFLTRSFFLGKKLRTRRRRSCSRITKKPGHFPYIKQLYIYLFIYWKWLGFFVFFLFIILFFRFCYCSKLAHMSFYKICRIQFSMPKNNIEGHCTTRRKKFINSHFICNNIQILATGVLHLELQLSFCHSCT